MTTSVGYGGSSDRIVHFGLSKDTVVQKIEIKWPSGQQQVITNIRADQLLTIQESR